MDAQRRFKLLKTQGTYLLQDRVLQQALNDIELKVHLNGGLENDAARKESETKFARYVLVLVQG